MCEVGCFLRAGHIYTFIIHPSLLFLTIEMYYGAHCNGSNCKSTILGKLILYDLGLEKLKYLPANALLMQNSFTIEKKIDPLQFV